MTSQALAFVVAVELCVVQRHRRVSEEKREDEEERHDALHVAVRQLQTARQTVQQWRLPPATQTNVNVLGSRTTLHQTQARTQSLLSCKPLYKSAKRSLRNQD